MNKMATDTFSTFLLYLVENLLGMVCVRERGQNRCHHGRCCSEGTITSTNMFETHKKHFISVVGGQSANSDLRKYLNQLKYTFNGGEYFCTAYEYESNCLLHTAIKQ